MTDNLSPGSVEPNGTIGSSGGGYMSLPLRPSSPAILATWQDRRTQIRTLQVVFLIVVFLFVHRETLRTLPTMWVDHDRLEGFLVPLASLFLVWRKRHQLAALTPRPSLVSGAFVTLLAGALLVLGKVGAVYVLQEISLLVSIIGLVLLLLGPSYLTALCLPIALLSFMLTILEDLTNPLHWPFQLLTARQATAIMHLVGFPALLDRQFIVLPHITLEVARVCSGINYLISVLAIALPLAHLTLRTWPGRLALIVSGVAIGIVANWARIVLIALWSAHGGQGLHGPFHVLQGMFVAWVGYAFLFLGSWLLSRAEPRFPACRLERSVSPVPTQENRRAATPEEGPAACAAWHRAWGVAVVVLVALSAYLYFYAGRPTVLRMDLAAFPQHIGDWIGETIPIRDAPLRMSGADAELLRSYRNREGDALQVYVGYLSSQSPGKKIPNDATGELHGGADRVTLGLSTGESVVINDRRFARERNTPRLLFWYQTDGQIVADRYRMKLATMRNALLSGRTHGAFVSVRLDTRGDRDSERQWKEAERFLQALVPALRAYLP